jgi:hypothetical protein
MKIVACSITRKIDPCQTKIFKSFEKINKYNESKKIDLKLKCNNSTVGLSEYYNNCIDKYAESCDYMVLVHDDVQFINMDLQYQIEKSMEVYDIVGVAGCINPKITDINLWHLMSDKQNLKGFAGHTCVETQNECYVTVFGPSPSRVTMIDGVFMVINCKKILKTKTRFDEKFKFHHYDLDFSISSNFNKLKIGVWPILIDHASPGLRSFNEEWKASNEYFKQKWIKK